MPYVYSTATCDAKYCAYVPTPAGAHGPRTIEKSVYIKGGHGVASTFKNSNLGMVHTPYGVATCLSDEDLEFLLNNSGFKAAVDGGFITYDKASKPDAEKKAKSMAQKDGSSPMTPKDLDRSAYSEPGSEIYKAKKL